MAAVIEERLEDKLLELVKDVTLRIGWASIMAKEIVINKEELIDRVISRAIYIFLMEDMVLTMFQAHKTEQVFMKAFAGIVGKTVMDALVKMMRNKDFTFTNLVIDNSIGEAIGFAWDALTLIAPMPSNGRVRVI